MLKTIVNFRWDKGKLSIDGCLTREWDKDLVDAASSIGLLNNKAMHEMYKDSPLTKGMEQLAHAEWGMNMRARCDGAVEGPFNIDHAEPLSDKDLIAWYRANQKRGK